MIKSHIVALSVLLGLVTTGLTACTPEVERTSARAARADTVAPTTTTPAARTTRAPARALKAAPPAVAKFRVPSVVGRNHQEAQNLMQASGLYALAEEDVTGQGRMLLYDRNWIVVRQSPRAGASVAPDTTIMLYSKKIGE